MPRKGKEPSTVSLPGRKGLPEPFTLVIFGASGDLTRRKLIPAVYALSCERLLPEGFSVVGFARRDKTDESFRGEMHEAVKLFSRVQPVDDATWRRFAAKLHYHRAGFDDPDGFRLLAERLSDIAREKNCPCNPLFYLATQPAFFVPIVEKLRDAGLVSRGAPWSRVIVEKPFGRDLESARQLNKRLRCVFGEDQIFRIDHYMGKETVQNLLVFRFANSIFEPVWNQKYVDHVQITVSEILGVEKRGKYYDQAGALRDIVQNHMMHLLCLVAMESPIRLDADAVRDEKIKVLQALRPISPECAANGVVRAQYGAGTFMGKPAPGYLDEQDVAPDSVTETFVAFKAYIDNWRWAGVPFYLRTGKRLPTRLTEISIHFKQVPQILFNDNPATPMPPNVLTLRIQPREGISLRFQVKVPGLGVNIRPLEMDFGYAESFGKEPPEAYERLLLDAASGDSTLFTRSDEVEAAWAFVSPIIEGCTRAIVPRLPAYPAGTWGPKEADGLIEADGRRWELMRRSKRGIRVSSG